MVAGVDKEQALATLESSPASTHERLRAARFLARNVTGTDWSRLTQIRGGERNSWVRQVLDQALTRSQLDTPVGPTVAVEQLQDTHFQHPHLYDELRAQAIEETSGLFLHELRPLIGLLEGSAAREIDRYACSRTKPESTDGRREGWASWDEGAYKGEALGAIGTDVSLQRVFSSRAGPRERSMDAGNRVIVETGRSRMHSRTGRTRVWRRWVGCG